MQWQKGSKEKLFKDLEAQSFPCWLSCRTFRMDIEIIHIYLWPSLALAVAQWQVRLLFALISLPDTLSGALNFNEILVASNPDLAASLNLHFACQCQPF